MFSLSQIRAFFSPAVSATSGRGASSIGFVPDGGLFVPSFVFVHDTETGVTHRATKIEDRIVETWDLRHGDMSCDCNRALFFAQAADPSMTLEEGFSSTDGKSCTYGRYRMAFHGTEGFVFWSDMPDGWTAPAV